MSKDGDYIDTFMRTDRIFQANVHQLADAMTSYEQKYPDEVNDYRDLWTTALRHAKRHAYDYEPEYSSMATVRYFEQEFHANSKKDSRECRVFYGNSMAIRLGCIYAHQYVFCNRGVNGIEGTLSAAAGLSIYLSEYHHPDAKNNRRYSASWAISVSSTTRMPSGTRTSTAVSASSYSIMAVVPSSASSKD